MIGTFDCYEYFVSALESFRKINYLFLSNFEKIYFEFSLFYEELSQIKCYPVKGDIPSEQGGPSMISNFSRMNSTVNFADLDSTQSSNLAIILQIVLFSHKQN